MRCFAACATGAVGVDLTHHTSFAAARDVTIGKDNNTPMTTPKDKSQEGPYTVERKDSQMATLWDIVGPTSTDSWYGSEGEAQREAKYLNAAYAAGQAAQWISVNSPPPHDKGVIVQIKAPTPFYLTAHYWGPGKGIDGWSIGNVIQWMDIPAAPTSNT